MYDNEEIIAAMRKRPGMYVGGTDATGIYHLVQEVVSNSLDQYLAGDATKIHVNCSPDCISVCDDGPGLPPIGPRADFTQWFTEYRDQPSAIGHAPHVHLEPVGCGLIVLNGLTECLKVESCREGMVSVATFSRGELLEFNTRQASGIESGTSMQFVPDPDLFECRLPDHSHLRHKLFDAVHLVPGVQIRFNEEIFYSSSGLTDLAQILFGYGRYYPTFVFRHSASDVTIDAVAAGPTLVAGERQVCSWANGSRTEEHGSHVNGFLSAIKGVRKARWNPSSLLINVTMREPKFAGPTRGRLCVPEFEERVRELLQPAFERFTSTLPDYY